MVGRLLGSCVYKEVGVREGTENVSFSTEQDSLFTQSQSSSSSPPDDDK